MKKFKSFATVCVLVTALLLCAVLAGCNEAGDNIVKVPTQEEYTYINPDETKADADAGMKIDGVLDEAVYDEKNWLYLSNDDGGNHVNIATTSHFGEKGMYFVFDVTETVPIYVNLDRAAYMNSCIELYLAPPYIQSVNDNSVFEIDLLPTGDLIFKKSNGKYGYENVGTTNDIMAYLGATTKGGEVNTPDCYGYVLELFIPWDFMQWLGIDSEAVQAGHTFINIAHITSNNLMGTNTDLDRYWYHYIQQLGVDFTNIRQYFRFDGNGVQGTTKLELEAGEHYSYKGNDVVFPGMVVPITIMPDDGYALTSVTVDGQEQIQKAAFNEDGSITLNVRCSTAGQKISAKAEAVSQGKKTLSGKIRLNGHTDAFISYVGPFGEKPVTIDENGYFEIKDLDAGYYELKIEKLGYPATTRGIYLNRDVYTELAISLPMFTVVAGNSWILDEASDGVLYKINGRGEIIGNQAYNDFTFETYVKYDPELAKLGTDDYHLQQRSGIRILFSNGKCWHIDLMNEGGKYLIQYASFSGENSLFNWKNVHSLTEEQIAKYTGAEGIKLTVVRVGNQVALCLEDKALFIEELEDEYKDLTAQLGFESWIANTETMRVPFSITDSATLPQAPKIYFYSSNTWDVSKQDEGVVYKTGVAGVDTWLDAAVIGNDITTIARDLTPDANDYSMIYIFTFSNGEQFRVRLNHTDNDGKYRIQSMSGSTLFDAWKNHYTLTDAQAEKVKGEGIAYRVWINGTAAVVYLDGVEVCTYDLSKVVATGKPSGIEEATVSVHLRVDGVIGHTVAVPFQLKQTDPVLPAEVTIEIPALENGTITLDKDVYRVGDTVILTIQGAEGYFHTGVKVNGKELTADGNGVYSFVATEEKYTVEASFAQGIWKDNGKIDLSQQNDGVLIAPSTVTGNSGWVVSVGNHNSVSALVKDMSQGAKKDYAVMLSLQFADGKHASVRLVDKDGNGKYCLQAFNDSFSAMNVLYWLSDAENEAVKNGDGVWFAMTREGTTLRLAINGNTVTEIDMSAKGVTGDMTCVARVRIYHFGYETHLQFTLD